MRAAHCRHSVVVGGVSSEPLRERDGGHSTLGGGGVPVDQVGVGWVCTIVNSAGVLWLKCALHKHIAWISGVNKHCRSAPQLAQHGRRYTHAKGEKKAAGTVNIAKGHNV